MDQILIATTGLTGGIGSSLALIDPRILWVNYSRSQGWDITRNPQQIAHSIPKQARAFINLAHSGLSQITVHDLVSKTRPNMPIITVTSAITEWREDETPDRLKEYRNQKRAIKQYLETHSRPQDRTVSFGYVSTAKILNRYRDCRPNAMITPETAAGLILAAVYTTL